MARRGSNFDKNRERFAEQLTSLVEDRQKTKDYAMHPSINYHLTLVFSVQAAGMQDRYLLSSHIY
jgi:hypothetical protein